MGAKPMGRTSPSSPPGPQREVAVALPGFLKGPRLPQILLVLIWSWLPSSSNHEAP